jgi:putative cell wall-binding protein
MRRSTARVIAAGTVLAIAAATGLALAPSALAAAEAGGTSLTAASSKPTIQTGVSNQTAGDINVHLASNVASGDFITLSVDDSDVGANCNPNADSVLFASAPTVRTSTGGAVPLTSSLVSVGAACATATLKDGVRLTASAAITAPADITLSSVAYTVGTDAATGPVQLAIGAGALGATGSNAVLSNVKVASANSDVLLATSTNGQSISNLTFTEEKPGAIGAGGACVQIDLPADATFTPTSMPTVSATSGNGVPGAVTVDGPNHRVKFVVTTPSTTKTTYQLSGLKVDTDATTGPIDARVGSTCGGNDFEQTLRLAFIGTVDRIAGSDRYATAQQIAEAGGCVTEGHPVVIARGDNFPDALAASYLAGVNDVPILLTAPNSLPNETTAALKNIGATSVVLVGGPQAISNGVASILTTTPAYHCNGTTTGSNLSVDRAFGTDRYATARSIALKGGSVGTTDVGLDNSGCSAVRTAIVASGENFPDALAAGPLAFSGLTGSCGSGPLPLLLTQAGSLPAVTANTISDLGVQQVILLGGTAAVSGAVANAIDSLPGVNVVRIAGADRQGTAVAISQLLGSDLGGFTSSEVFVARGDNFPDALAAGPLAGATGSPIFLTQSTSQLGTTTANGIIDYPVLIDEGTLLGGTAALTPTVAAQVAATIALQPTPS